MFLLKKLKFVPIEFLSGRPEPVTPLTSGTNDRPAQPFGKAVRLIRWRSEES
jgi:hypothetical protein